MVLYKKVETVRARPVFSGFSLERLLSQVWEKRGLWILPLCFMVVVLVGYAGYEWYQDRYADQAAALLHEQKEWADANKVTQEFDRSDSAIIVRMAKGGKALKEKKWDEAVPLYESLLKLPPRYSFFRVAALQNLALVYREKKEWEKALDYLKQAENDPENALPDYSRFLTAQVLLDKGDTEGAVKIYDQLAKEASLPDLRTEAEKRKTSLAAPKQEPSKKAKKRGAKK
ncbi:MAG: tetratricopeptide repeat protein [Deltaproteobacteria bacterium]|nr:tetratricopeptide repeat protein [Deltaproteobacteria bacterium]